MPPEKDTPLTLGAITNLHKFIVLVLGLSSLYWGLKLDNQSLKDEIRLMISDYKSADKVHDIMITALEEKNKEQDKNIDHLYVQVSGIVPDEIQPKMKRRR